MMTMGRKIVQVVAVEEIIGWTSELKGNNLSCVLHNNTRTKPLVALCFLPFVVPFIQNITKVEDR